MFGEDDDVDNNMEDPSDELPSHKVYKILGSSKCYSDQGGIYRGKRDEISRKSHIGTYANKIMDAWCYAIWREKYSMKSHPGEPCYSLYFYLGSLFYGNSSDTEFSNRMKTVYDVIKDAPYRNKCYITYPDSIKKELFHDLKKLYEYSQDHELIEQKLQSSEEAYRSKYCTRLHEVISAYDAVQRDCDTNTGRKYCTELKGKYKKYNEEGLSQLTSKCEEVALEAEDPAVAKGTVQTQVKLTKVNLGMLESNIKYYKRFIDSRDYCSYPCFPRKKIYDKLKAYFGNDKYANVVARALCYASTKIWGDREPRDPFCEFFNFWFGHLLYKKLNDESNFSQVIEAINKELGQIPEKYKCPLPDTTINDATDLNNRRIVYEYFIDHKKITEDLSRATPTSDSKPASPPTTKPQCDKKYSEHLKSIVSAFNALSSKCTNGVENDFCRVFNKTYKALFEGDKLSKLTCTLQEEEGAEEEEVEGGDDPLLPSPSSLSRVSDLPDDDDQTGNCTEQLSEMLDTFPGQIESGSGPGAGAAPIIVSSIFGVVGLPTFTYLLYKVSIINIIIIELYINAYMYMYI
ncbi:Uncharacterized protein PCOAH_00013050 [Plasmodium coatneyi]|uniref:KIR protein n=1 Tax=Plasmodium coatneyi TaxID=208452 RepID=A0A1B1DW74_9APIC|nr:Uncharacterized protein PCOAH_00013050 [Plasmodium coatneyi]ANQ07032.1 Uncharacterized protein PCOAH_00013050 [Plasmodium coatneyi]